jgi:hypothetical protein
MQSQDCCIARSLAKLSRLDRRVASAGVAFVRSHDYALLCFTPAAR